MPEKRQTTRREIGLLGAAVSLFIAVSAWWLTQDTRMPDYDSGIHLHTAFIYWRAIANGNLAFPFTSYDSYPPLVHTLGALSIAVFGMHPMALIMVSNLVFVPLLAFGCYGTGRIVAGPRAGLLAGLLALGSPMVVSMMHVYDLDPPQAAMVAVSVWALLASRRFASTAGSLGAGLACGLALMTKETSVIFLGGLVLSIILRGGWRNALGGAVFLLTGFATCGVWYVLHLHELTATLHSIGGFNAGPTQSPPRWSLDSVSWYFWDLVNQQVLAPFALAFLVGLLVAVRQISRSPAVRRGYLPDLLIGASVSYAGMSYLIHKDPRYTLPALVYVAVIGTFWIPGIVKSGARRATTFAVGAAAAVNFFGMSFGLGGISARTMAALPGATTNLIYPGYLTLYEDQGWVRGGPMHDGDALALLQGLHRQGVRTIATEPSVNQVDFSFAGLLPLADEEHIAELPAGRLADRYLVLRPIRRNSPRPCQTIRGSGGIEEPNAPRLGVYVLRNRPSGTKVAAGGVWDHGVPYSIACPSHG